MTNHNGKNGQPAEPAQPDNQKRDAFQTASLSRQLFIIGAIAMVLAGVIMVTRSHAQSTSKQAAQGGALDPNQVLVAKAAADVIELKTSKVAIEAGKRTIRTNGTVRFSPYATINVSPRLVGRVKTVFVRVGDRVAAGEPLAEMVSTDAANAVDTARDSDEQVQLTGAALETARRQFRMGTPEVTAAEAALYQAHENSVLTKRQMDLTREQNGIGGFTDKPLTDAQSAVKQTDTQLSQDEKDLALAQKQFDRTSKLFAIGAAAKQDVGDHPPAV